MVSPQRNRASVEPPLLLSAVLANPQSLTVSRKIANEGLRARQLAVSLCSIETPVASRSVHHARMNKREDAKRATVRAERIEALQRWQRNHDSNNGAVNQSKLVTQPLLPSSPVQQLSLHDSAILTKEALGNLVNQYVYALGEEAASGVSSPAMPASPTTGDSSGAFPPKGMPAAAGLLRTSSPERSKAQQHAQKFLQRARGEHSESGAGSTVDGDMHSRRQRDANLIDIGKKKLDDSMSSFVKECGFVTVNATPQELRARRLEEEESVVHAKRKAREAEQGYIRQAMVKETERQVRHLLKHVVHIKNMSTTAGSVQEALEAKMQPQVVMNYFRGAVNTAGGHSVTTAGGHSGIAGASSTTFGGGGLRRKNLLQPLPLLGGSNKESNISVVVPSGPVGLHRSYVSSVDSNQGGGTSYTTVVVQGPTVPLLTHGHHLLHHHSFLALGVEATGGSSVLTNTIDELLLTASSPNNTTTMQQNNQQLSPNMSHHQSLAQQHNHRSYASQRDHTAMTSIATTCSPARTSTAANKAALLSTVSATTQFRLGVLLRCVVALVSLHFPTSRAFADRFRKGASVGSVGSKVIPPQQRLPLSWVSLVASMFPAWFPCTCSLVANINAVVASWTTSDDLPDDNHNTLTGIATPLIAVTEEGTVDLEGWLYVCAMLLEQDDMPSSTEEDSRPAAAPSPFSASPSSSTTAAPILPSKQKATVLMTGGAVTCRAHELRPTMKDIVKLMLGELPVSCPSTNVAQRALPAAAKQHKNGGTGSGPTAAEAAAIHKLQLTRQITAESATGRPPATTGIMNHKVALPSPPTLHPQPSASITRYVTGLIAGAMVHSSASYCVARVWTQWLPEVPFLTAVSPAAAAAAAGGIVQVVTTATTSPRDSSLFLPLSLIQQQQHHHPDRDVTTSSTPTVEGTLAAMFQKYQLLASTNSAAASQQQQRVGGCCSCSAPWCLKRCEELRMAAMPTASPLPLLQVINYDAPTPNNRAGDGGQPMSTFAAELWRVPASGGPPQPIPIAQKSVLSAASSTSSAPVSSSAAGEGHTPSNQNRKKHLAVLSPGRSIPSSTPRPPFTAGILLLSLSDLDTVFTHHFSAACGAVPTIPIPSHFYTSSSSSSMATTSRVSHVTIPCHGSPLFDALTGMQVRMVQHQHPHHHHHGSGHRSPSSEDGSTSWSPNATLPGHGGGATMLSISTHSSENHNEDNDYSTSENNNAMSLAEQHVAMVAQCEQERSALLVACRAHLRSHFLASDGDRDGAWSWYEFGTCTLTALLATWSRQLHGVTKGRLTTMSDVAAGIVNEFLAAQVFPSTLGATSMEGRKKCEALRQVLDFLDSECDAFGFVSTR